MRTNLKVLRITNHLTQEQMAKRLGVTRTTYCNIENGKSSGTTAFWLSVKAEFPDCDIDVIMKTEERATA